jgi:hypothetical protein
MFPLNSKNTFYSYVVATREVWVGRLQSEAGPWQKVQDLIRKITKAEKGWGRGSSGRVLTLQR